MALDFNDINGGAKKSSVDYMKLVDGMNKFRILPKSITPSYTYWIKGANGKDQPFECLAFQPKIESFDRTASDPVRDAGLKDAKGEDIKCQWSYRCQVINDASGEVQVLQLKKGMLTDIISAAKQLKMDPTNLDTGCWISVKRVKTGPLQYNVKYEVQQLLMRPEALTDELKEKALEAKPMGELFERESYDAQAERLRKHVSGDAASENTGGEVDSEATSDLD
jgi:hypothetical protein